MMHSKALQGLARYVLDPTRLSNSPTDTHLPISTGARRFQSTQQPTFIARRKAQASFRQNWLSDPSTYPLLAALGGALMLCAGVGFSCLAYSPDVRLSNDKKHAIIRNWSLRG